MSDKIKFPFNGRVNKNLRKSKRNGGGTKCAEGTAVVIRGQRESKWKEGDFYLIGTVVETGEELSFSPGSIDHVGGKVSEKYSALTDGNEADFVLPGMHIATSETGKQVTIATYIGEDMIKGRRVFQSGYPLSQVKVHDNPNAQGIGLYQVPGWIVDQTVNDTYSERLEEGMTPADLLASLRDLSDQTCAEQKLDNPADEDEAEAA